MTKQWPKRYDSLATAAAIMELPKHVLADLYRDLFYQTHGESESTDNMAVSDAARRARLLGHARYARLAEETLLGLGGAREAAADWWEYDEGGER